MSISMYELICYDYSMARKAGFKHTEATRQRISEATKGRVSNNLGKKFSPEHRAKISKALKGRVITPEWRQKISDNHGGYKGDDVGYSGVHLWIRTKFGQPSKCELCDIEGLSGRKIHWANKNHQYKRVREDWVRLCASCHRVYDLQMGLRVED